MKVQVIRSSALLEGVKKSGKPYKGFYLEGLKVDHNGEIRVFDEFINYGSMVEPFAPDSMIDIQYGPRGFIDNIVILPKKEPLFMLRG